MRMRTELSLKDPASQEGPRSCVARRKQRGRHCTETARHCQQQGLVPDMTYFRFHKAPNLASLKPAAAQCVGEGHGPLLLDAADLEHAGVVLDLEVVAAERAARDVNPVIAWRFGPAGEAAVA